VADVSRFVAGCALCQRRRTPNDSGGELLHPILVVCPFERMGLDILGPLPHTTRGNTHIVVFGEYHTKG
jgi:hypothetical protein